MFPEFSRAIKNLFKNKALIDVMEEILSDAADQQQEEAPPHQLEEHNPITISIEAEPVLDHTDAQEYGKPVWMGWDLAQQGQDKSGGIIFDAEKEKFSLEYLHEFQDQMRELGDLAKEAALSMGDACDVLKALSIPEELLRPMNIDLSRDMSKSNLSMATFALQSFGCIQPGEYKPQPKIHPHITTFTPKPLEIVEEKDLYNMSIQGKISKRKVKRILSGYGVKNAIVRRAAFGEVIPVKNSKVTGGLFWLIVFGKGELKAMKKLYSKSKNFPDLAFSPATNKIKSGN